MPKVIGVTDLQRKFRLIFDEVAHKNMPYVLTRGNRPEATLIPHEVFLQFQEFQEKAILERFDRFTARMAEQNAAYSEAEIMADIEEARLRLE